ncbi:hypothetical protein BDW74DRAFT_169650 [Aspergillus multicolor]|uniref:DUF202 domain-containing protein n=1 Tax=Aspergillus multicolor TaxID=41759 RepID=UPI003CCCC907
MANPLASPQSVPFSDPVGSVPRSASQTAHTDTDSSPQSPRDEGNLDPDNLELHEIETHQDDDSGASISSGEYRITTRRTVSRTETTQTQPRHEGFLGRIQRFWTRNVVLTVAQKKNRDYFALERTFLAYIRTSVIFAMQGVLIAQLFRLQSTHSSKGLGYHDVGVPLSVTCHCAAILTAVLGAHRFWKQQSAIALGTVYAGGWELNCIGFLTTAVSPEKFDRKAQSS